MNLFRRTVVPALLGVAATLGLAAAGGDARADTITTLIGKTKSNTAVGFTGGYGNVIGVHKFARTRYTVFYADDVGSASNKHSHAVIRRGGDTWTFAFDGKGRLVSAEDGEGARISLVHSKGGSFRYTVETIDGFRTATKSGTVKKKQIRKIRKTLAEPAAVTYEPSRASAADPQIVVPVEVNGCTSWPKQAGTVRISYDFGLGEQSHVVEMRGQAGTTFDYDHVIRPYAGLRSKKLAKALVTTGFPGAKVSACDITAQLTALCKKVGGEAKTACNAARSAMAMHCNPKKLAVKTAGVTRAGITSKLKSSVEVTAEAVFVEPAGAVKKVVASGTYDFATPGAPLPVTLPCWDVYQSSLFLKKSTFSAHGGKCNAPIDIGRQLFVAIPTTAPNPPYSGFVTLDNYKFMHQKNCFKGNYFSDYFLNTLGGGSYEADSVSQYYEQGADTGYREVYDFNFTRTPTQLSGTYTFTLDHFKFGHSGTYVIPLTLPLISASQ